MRLLIFNNNVNIIIVAISACIRVHQNYKLDKIKFVDHMKKKYTVYCIPTRTKHNSKNMLINERKIIYFGHNYYTIQ